MDFYPFIHSIADTHNDGATARAWIAGPFGNTDHCCDHVGLNLYLDAGCRSNLQDCHSFNRKTADDEGAGLLGQNRRVTPDDEIDESGMVWFGSDQV